MLTMEDWASVRHLHSQGISCRAIVRKRGLSRNTDRKYLADARDLRLSAYDLRFLLRLHLALGGFGRNLR